MKISLQVLFTPSRLLGPLQWGPFMTANGQFLRYGPAGGSLSVFCGCDITLPTGFILKLVSFLFYQCVFIDYVCLACWLWGDCGATPFRLLLHERVRVIGSRFLGHWLHPETFLLCWRSLWFLILSPYSKWIWKWSLWRQCFCCHCPQLNKFALSAHVYEIFYWVHKGYFATQRHFY